MVLFSPGAFVFLPHAERGWALAVVQSQSGEMVTVELLPDRNETLTVAGESSAHARLQLPQFNLRFAQRRPWWLPRPTTTRAWRP